jgi:uncharacterized protein
MAAGTTDRSGLEVLDMQECLELLQSVPIGRVAMVDGGEIAVLPVNHVVDGNRVCFRTAPGAKLDAGIMQHVITFEADDYDEATQTGWSVVIKGRADLVTDEQELERLRASGIRPWSNPTFRTNWVTLHASTITGRRISPAGD